ncbi:MAG: tRNA (guanosine(37)-N1)-methyltransferase TrmD [Bacilli bacterium]|nr:tRNA (guanosine(37)-N1)-methyltransferase TrmD [Bacilli bacterium]
MKIDVVTIFPDMFQGVLNESIIKRAIDKGIVEINIHNFRDYSLDPHGKVDDTPFGGGAGMVLACQPIFDCIESLKTKDSLVIMLTPDGLVYNQNIALELSSKKHLILLCGHYEGFDERIKSICDMFISVGDYILTGGEIPSMILIDSITRLIDGSITKESLESESFSDNLLDYPTYTKPRTFRDMEVPSVLLSGDHQKIAEWRHLKKLEKTKELRPDLLEDSDERY